MKAQKPAQQIIETVEELLEERKIKQDRRINHTQLPPSIERRKNPERRQNQQ